MQPRYCRKVWLVFIHMAGAFREAITTPHVHTYVRTLSKLPILILHQYRVGDSRAIAVQNAIREAACAHRIKHWAGGGYIMQGICNNWMHAQTRENDLHMNNSTIKWQVQCPNNCMVYHHTHHTGVDVNKHLHIATAMQCLLSVTTRTSWEVPARVITGQALLWFGTNRTVRDYT